MQFFDVTRIWDASIRPPKLKLFVCINIQAGVFFRINTQPWHRPCIKLSVAEHMFLNHDSYLECSPLEVDEYVIQESLQRFGVIGSIRGSLAEAAKTALRDNARLRLNYINEIAAYFPDKNPSGS